MNKPAKQTRKSFIEDLRKEEGKRGVLNFLGRPIRSPKLLAIGLVFYVAVLVIIAQPREHRVRDDVPVRNDVISRVAFEYEDTAATESKQQFEREKVPPVFDLDSKNYGEGISKNLKNDIKSLIQDVIDKEDLAQVDAVLKNSWLVNDKKTLSSDDFKHLKKELSFAKQDSSTRDKIYESFYHFIDRLCDRYWIEANAHQDLTSRYMKSDRIRIANMDKEISRNALVVYKEAETGGVNPAAVEVANLLEKSMDQNVKAPLDIFVIDPDKSKSILVNLFVNRIGVNLSFNKEETQLARDRVAQYVKSTYDFPADTLILKKGYIPSKKDIDRVNQERKTYKEQGQSDTVKYYSIVGRAFVFTFFYFIFLIVLTEKKSSITRNQGRFFSFSVLTAMVLFSAFWLEAKGWSTLCIPFLFVAEVFQIAYKRRDSLLAIIFMGVSLTLVMNSPGVALTLTLGSLAALYCSRNIKSRLTLLFSGLVGGITMATVDLATLMPWMPIGSEDFAKNYSAYFSDAGMALLNGVVTGILITVILPFIEQIFQITTPLTWLELGNMNHPALKRIAMHSPGTWQHSLMLSALSEAGAEAIGGDSLMSRVVCYYHDLGKSLKPQYYIENQQGGGVNPHDKLTPAMSALIIHSHPKDGAELARQYKLPDEVIDAILQHHGTTRVEYFYRMAMKNAENPDDISEDKYTYPGPKPQYKEMGIIMLADSAESATRSLKNPTPGKIRSTIENIVKNKIEMGQLDESGLTLTEIATVIETFTRVINNIHHHRIEYPDDPRKTSEKANDTTPVA